MAKGIGNGVKQAPSIWGPLTADQIADAERRAVELARRQPGREDVVDFFDLEPHERQAAREAALNEHG